MMLKTSMKSTDLVWQSFAAHRELFLRDIIVKHIEQNWYHRPSYNQIKNEEQELVNYQVYETLHLMQTLIINLMPMQ